MLRIYKGQVIAVWSGIWTLTGLSFYGIVSTIISL